MVEVVVTVEGPVAPDELGVTLVHEHLHADWTALLATHGYEAVGSGQLALATAAEARWNPGAYPDNYRLDDLELVAEELVPLASAGAHTVVDCTPSGCGRDPVALAELAGRSGLNVVMGCGWYLGPHPPGVGERDVDELAAELLAEIRAGVGGTGIQPGIIGEIGTSGTLAAGEERVLRAAAIAQRETGLALSVHLHPWHEQGTRVLDVIEREGGDPTRTILNHLSTAIGSRGYLDELGSRGAWLAFDLFGFDHSLLGLGRYPPSDHDVAAAVVELAERGWIERLLVSQDVAVRTRLRAYGGWGYDHLLVHVVPLLAALGLRERDLTTLLVDNPRRALATTVRSPHEE
jgi:phosphotriesterase-related protein